MRQLVLLLAAFVIGGCSQNLGQAEITCRSGGDSWTTHGEVEKDGDTYVIKEEYGGITRAPVADCEVYQESS